MTEQTLIERLKTYDSFLIKKIKEEEKISKVKVFKAQLLQTKELRLIVLPSKNCINYYLKCIKIVSELHQK